MKALLLAMLVLPLVGSAEYRRGDESALQLINELEIGASPLLRSGILTCGSAGAENARQDKIARSLIALGSAALPDVEVALSSKGTRYGFLTLAYAYAKLKGPAAFPRLRALMTEYRESGLGRSAAAAIGATSFVSSNADSWMRDHQCAVGEFSVQMQKEPCQEESQEIPLMVVACGRPILPQSGMDRFILGWEWDDRHIFERALGPHAKETSRSTMTPSGSVDPLANKIPREEMLIGYKFLTPGPFSEREDEHDWSQRSERPDAVDIETAFFNAEGESCGAHVVVHFTRGSVRDPRPSTTSTWDPETHEMKTTRGPAPEWALTKEYFVDNPNLDDLFQTLRACATRR